MQLLGKKHLSSLLGQDKTVDVWVSAWVAEVSNANWKTPDELTSAFPRACSCGDCVYLFPVCESGNGLKLLFSFDKGIALIQEVTKNE
ncbi:MULTISPECIES: type II toxin-antitoxin system HigB family toxin [Aeromonas]|uniref:type II toxin-antitoxin system HigB family toxin n=1 Tax=Aeromonas TaxID=642 RepID=UPI001A8DE94E|nr:MULTISPECIES: type II toxin-antitoxin system HigB family toxin [Aeromonas]MBQ4668734.1 hypothetical protein [Aeromonas hydrophila]MBQ4716876.1 hypothetical protein [Aeromonas hydrophila]MBW3825775.1 hypothetical protein [Aeromonas hydrophila]MBW5270860.1 hypothetical protein [Aeromonas hydrophila]MDX7872303.1 type II toxin-antitoxin system HigB family toxin [Aeromonas caviae]